jgi:hypothetical protein
MAVAAHNPASAVKQRLGTPRLVIIEFIFGKLSVAGSASQVLHTSLLQNYMGVSEKLHHERIVFDICSANSRNHLVRISNIVKKLQKK